MKKQLTTLLIVCCLLFAGCSKAPKEVDYYIAEKNATADDLVESIGSEPSKIETQDDAEMYVYNECNYYDYTGEMTYYFAQDMLSLSRWESIAESEQAGKDMYQNILNKIKEENGEGTLSEDGNSCVWDTDKKTITLGYVHDEEGYKVYVLESGK